MRLRFITGSLIVLLAAGATGAFLLWRSRADRTEAPAADGIDDAAPTTPGRGGPRMQALRALDAQHQGQPGPHEPEDGAKEGPTLSPRESRERQLQKIVQSGPDRRGLLASARQVHAAWAEEARRNQLDVKVGVIRCFAGGCLVSMEHGSELLVDRMTEHVTQSAMFHRWNAGKMRTGPVEEAGGKVEATWVLFPPADGEPTLQAGEFAGPGQPPTTSPPQATSGP